MSFRNRVSSINNSTITNDQQTKTNPQKQNNHTTAIMKFSAITALFAGVAAAANEARAGSETVNITDLSVRKTSGEATTIQSVSFKLNGNLACEASNPAFPSDSIACGGESGYSFALVAGTPADQSEFGLRLSRDTGSA